MIPTDRLTMRSTTFDNRVKENTAAAVMLTMPARPVASKMEMSTGSIVKPLLVPGAPLEGASRAFYRARP
jgi:hypothetical protein